jgi:hypothetical protein
VFQNSSDISNASVQPDFRHLANYELTFVHNRLLVLVGTTIRGFFVKPAIGHDADVLDSAEAANNALIDLRDAVHSRLDGLVNKEETSQ